MPYLEAVRQNALTILAIALVTITALHFTLGAASAADKAASSCFHYVCDAQGTCTSYVINHTCCFVQDDGGGAPECEPESCLLGGVCDDG